jgi:hypothetical protein
MKFSPMKNKELNMIALEKKDFVVVEMVVVAMIHLIFSLSSLVVVVKEVLKNLLVDLM